MAQASTPAARPTGRPVTITHDVAAGVEPEAADRSQRRSRSHRRSRRRTASPSSPRRCATFPASPTPPTLSPPDTSRSATRAPATSTTSTTASSATARCSTRPHPNPSSTRSNGDKRTIASAMYIAESEYPFGSKQLDKLMGGLVTWHNHDNLCWTVVDGQPKVAAVTDNHGGVCPEGTVQAGGEAAMVHVWIRPHKCGVFSALEGHGAGSSFDRGGTRVDQCAHGHEGAGHGGQQALANWPRPFDPSKPIDLSGVEGVTAEQEAYGVELIESAKRDLPNYADAAAAEADGYRSIHDGGTGFEHLIKWELTRDGKMLDSDQAGGARLRHGRWQARAGVGDVHRRARVRVGRRRSSTPFSARSPRGTSMTTCASPRTRPMAVSSSPASPRSAARAIAPLVKLPDLPDGARVDRRAPVRSVRRPRRSRRRAGVGGRSRRPCRSVLG